MPVYNEVGCASFTELMYTVHDVYYNVHATTNLLLKQGKIILKRLKTKQKPVTSQNGTKYTWMVCASIFCDWLASDTMDISDGY